MCQINQHYWYNVVIFGNILQWFHNKTNILSYSLFRIHVQASIENKEDLNLFINEIVWFVCFFVKYIIFPQWNIDGTKFQIYTVFLQYTQLYVPFENNNKNDHRESLEK